MDSPFGVSRDPATALPVDTVTSKCPWPPDGQLSKLQVTVHWFAVTVNCRVVLFPTPVCWSNAALPLVSLEFVVVVDVEEFVLNVVNVETDSDVRLPLSLVLVAVPVQADSMIAAIASMVTHLTPIRSTHLTTACF